MVRALRAGELRWPPPSAPAPGPARAVRGPRRARPGSTRARWSRSTGESEAPRARPGRSAATSTVSSPSASSSRTRSASRSGPGVKSSNSVLKSCSRRPIGLGVRGARAADGIVAGRCSYRSVRDRSDRGRTRWHRSPPWPHGPRQQPRTRRPSSCSTCSRIPTRSGAGRRSSSSSTTRTTRRLDAGARVRVTGRLAGVPVGFDVEVHAADEERLRAVGRRTDRPSTCATTCSPATAAPTLSASVSMRSRRWPAGTPDGQRRRCAALGRGARQRHPADRARRGGPVRRTLSLSSRWLPHSRDVSTSASPAPASSSVGARTSSHGTPACSLAPSVGLAPGPATSARSVRVSTLASVRLPATHGERASVEIELEPPGPAGPGRAVPRGRCRTLHASRCPARG